MSVRTFHGVVYPAQCDAMGHMNVQHYVAAFDQAFWHLVAACGYSTVWIAQRREGWADVRYEIDFRSELDAGGLYTIDSDVRQIGTTSLTSHHVLSADGVVRAELLAISVYLDLEARRKKPLPDSIRTGARALAFTGGEARASIRTRGGEARSEGEL